MHRLYFRIYLAVLASLMMLAVLAGISFRLFGDLQRFGPRPEFFPAAAEQLLPPATAKKEDLEQALERWRSLSGFDLAVFDAEGHLLAQSAGEAVWEPEAKDERFTPRRHRPHFWSQVVDLADGRWLVVAKPSAERGFLRRFAWLGILAAITFTVGLCAYPVVRRLTRRLETLQRGVAAFGEGQLSSRVPVEGKDEVARLAETFNNSANRIEKLVAANKSMLANASHELRSPLARLRMQLETLAPADARRAEIAADIAELDQLIEEILLASRLEAAAPTMASENIDVVALLAEECARTGADLDVRATALPQVQGDERLLRRLVRNLLENADRHAGGKSIEAVVQPSTSVSIRIDICDRGPGIPEGERERIFEPFHRLPGSREGQGGAGLGLALVRQIAARHHGSVVCLPREGGGTVFRVTLPALPSR